MSQVTISIKTEREVKEGFADFCENVGCNMSSAINMFMKTVLREQRIPFEIKNNIPNKETIKAFEEVENNRNLNGPFSSVEEVMRDLNA